jgi:hypothetical protein
MADTERSLADTQSRSSYVVYCWTIVKEGMIHIPYFCCCSSFILLFTPYFLRIMWPKLVINLIFSFSYHYSSSVKRTTM